MSGESTGFHKYLRFLTFLFNWCPGGNRHWWYKKRCVCVENCNDHGIYVRQYGDVWWHDLDGEEYRVLDKYTNIEKVRYE